MSSRHAKGRRNNAANVSPASTTKSPIAKAGLVKAVPFTVDPREHPASSQRLRREVHTHDVERRGDSDGAAAVRGHSIADNTGIPIVVRLGRTLRERGLAVKANIPPKAHVNNRTCRYLVRRYFRSD